MLDHNLVLKSDELYVVGDSNTDGSGERATGLYARDTRYLDRFDVRLDGVALDRLSARVHGPARAAIVGTNGARPVEDGADGDDLLHPHTIAVEQEIRLGVDLCVGFTLRNFSGGPRSLTFDVTLGADFRDLFDIRGFPRSKRGGRFLPPRATADGAVLGYVDRSRAPTTTTIAFDRAPTSLDVVAAAASIAGAEQAVLLPGYDRMTERAPLPTPPYVVASFDVHLPAGGTWQMTTTIVPKPAGGVPVSAEPTLPDGHEMRSAAVVTDDPFFNRFLDRGEDDLRALQTSFPEGSLPAAGIPWYVAPFGRDSLIVGLQTFHAAPQRAAGTLRVLAALQGTKVDSFHDEEPGKILHEVRYGEMARLGEIPHTPYYGTVDATPLFVLLFAETVAWTGDDRLYRDLLPNVRRAVEWIERHGDVDGDGLVEYRSRSGHGAHIIHQGWKDSHDSLHHRDGRPASGAIALVEVQGYVFAGYRRLAEVVSVHGNAEWADGLRRRADAVRRRVEDAFWMEDDRFYAQALDGDKTPVGAISSNPGHLLFCGLPNSARAAAVAMRLGAPDLDSGWGVRTLSSTMPTYNPMSYHNGSVWPHDNSLIAAGLAAYGHATATHRLVAALFEAAETDPMLRLPELYCGFARAEENTPDAPVAYPVSCSPQAWAAASAQLLVRSMLGLRLDIGRRRLLVDPSLPPWLNELSIRGMDVLGERAEVTIVRRGDDYAMTAEGPVERGSGSPGAMN